MPNIDPKLEDAVTKSLWDHKKKGITAEQISEEIGYVSALVLTVLLKFQGEGLVTMEKDGRWKPHAPREKPREFTSSL
jgi:hypothetical protein